MGAVVFSQYFLSISFQNLVVLEQKIEKAKKKKNFRHAEIKQYMYIYLYQKKKRVWM